MKTTIICCEHSLGYFRALSNLKANDKPEKKKGTEEFTFVSNDGEFKKYKIKKHSPNVVWIFLDLQWKDTKLYHGYEIALLLLQQHGQKKDVFEIVFFSFFSRMYLLEHISDEKNIFPRAFSHYALPIHDIRVIKYSRPSKTIFEYIKKYALSRTNILSDIIHRLESLVNSDDIVRDIEPIVIRLNSVSNILSNEVRNLLLKPIDDLNLLNELLRELLICYRIYADKESKTLVNMRILRSCIILEDDAHICSKVTNWIIPYCEEVWPFHSGLEAKQCLKSQGEHVDLFVCDLELLEKSNIWQRPQGVEVLEYSKRHFPHIYTVVLSGLPTKAVEILLPDRVYYDTHLRKRIVLGTPDAMDTHLMPLVKKARDHAKRYSLGLEGPGGGLFGEIRTKYFSLKFSKDVEDRRIVDEIQQKSISLYNSYVKNELSANVYWSTELISTKTKDPGIIWNKLPLILALRKMVLHFVLRPNNKTRVKDRIKAYYFDYEEFKDREEMITLTKNANTFIRTQLSFIAFNLGGSGVNQEWYITLQNLFIEELSIVDLFNKSRKSDAICKFEVWNRLEKFMDKTNKLLGREEFTFDENAQLFTDKVRRIIDAMRKNKLPHHMALEWIDDYPYSVADIRQDFHSYELMRALTVEIGELEEELESIRDAKA